MEVKQKNNVLIEVKQNGWLVKCNWDYRAMHAEPVNEEEFVFESFTGLTRWLKANANYQNPNNSL